MNNTQYFRAYCQFYNGECGYVYFGIHQGLDGILGEKAQTTRIIKIEQCTGQADKKGKLIYGGDIVEYKISGAPNKSRDVIIYRDSVAAWFKGNNMLSTYSKTIEIIGNIHENPELLEPKQI